MLGIDKNSSLDLPVGKDRMMKQSNWKFNKDTIHNQEKNVKE